MDTTLEQVISPFLCQTFLNDLEDEFLESVGVDDLAYQHALKFYSLDLLRYIKFETEVERRNFFGL